MAPTEETKTANTSTSEKNIEQIEKRRQERKERLEIAKSDQLAKDLDALDALEQEHGDEQVKRLNVNGFKEGHPTFIVIRSPGGTPLYKRYADMVRRSTGNKESIAKAQEMLGESSVVYPIDDELKAMIVAFPGLTISAGLAAAKLVELDAADEKKG